MPRILRSGVAMLGDIFTASSSHGAAANARAEVEARSARNLQAAVAVQRINQLPERHALQAAAAA